MCKNSDVWDTSSPVLVAGFDTSQGFTGHRMPTPHTLFCGRVMERFHPGQALLLAPGPMARSVTLRGLNRHGTFAPYGYDPTSEGRLLVLNLRDRDGDNVLDELGNNFYLILEDTFGLVEAIERSDDNDWPTRYRLIQDSIHALWCACLDASRRHENEFNAVLYNKE